MPDHKHYVPNESISAELPVGFVSINTAEMVKITNDS